MMWVDCAVSMWFPSWPSSAYPNSSKSTVVSLSMSGRELLVPLTLSKCIMISACASPLSS